MNPFPPGDPHAEAWAAAELAKPYAEPTPLERLEAALVDTDSLDDIPEHDPLIPGVMNRDSLAWMFGAPASFKSFLGLDAAGSVATGTSWQGFPASEPGEVLYLVAEGSSGIRARVRAWEEYRGRPMKGVRFLPIAVQASSPEQWKAFISLAERLAPALIVIDTQARVTSGMEENSAKEMGEFVRRLDQLRVATGACVLTIHHTGRNGEHMRGSIAIDGAADTAIKIVRDEDRCTVQCTKQKDAEEFEPFLSRVEKIGDSIVLRRDETAAAKLSGALPAWITSWWKAHQTDLVSMSILVDGKVVAKQTFYNNQHRLMAAGVIERVGPEGRPKYRLLIDPTGDSPGSVPPVPLKGSGTGLDSSGTESLGLTGTQTGTGTQDSCTICGERLDKLLRDVGWTTHPSC